MKKTQAMVIKVVSLARSPVLHTPKRVSAIPDWAMMIHGRRMPREGNRMVSIIGAQKNLKVQGRIAMPPTVASCSLLWPASLRADSRATVAKPQGNPWAK